jgi:hypothetical protein
MNRLDIEMTKGIGIIVVEIHKRDCMWNLKLIDNPFSRVNLFLVCKLAGSYA